MAPMRNVYLTRRFDFGKVISGVISLCLSADEASVIFSGVIARSKESSRS